jgi:hypothetical protein
MTEALDELEQLDAQEYAGTLTGFDELAIERAFRHSLDDMSNLSAVRALLFVRLRREKGLKDSAAFTAAMAATQSDLATVWVKPDTSEADAEGEAQPPA